MASMSLGLAVTSACVTNQGGAAPWSPDSLFASSEVGAYYDVQDLSTLFQDDAGTTAVTATGDPVAYIADKSGNGFHMTQPVSGERGTLRQNALGYYYVEFPASCNVRSAATFGMSIPLYIACIVDATNNSTSQTVFGARSATNSAADFYHVVGASHAYGIQTQDATEGNDRVSSALATGPAGVPTVLDGILGDGTNTIAVNGGTDWTGATSVTSAFTKSSLRICVNSTNGDAAPAVAMNFYGGIIVNRTVSSADRANAVNWLKARCGISDLEGYTYDIFAIAGQSNGTGQGDKATSTSVTLGLGAEFTDGAILAITDPTRHYATSATGNVSQDGSAWPEFADAYYTATGRRACIVGGCASGIGLTTGGGWNPSWSTYGAALVAKTQAAKTFIELKGGTAVIRGMIWCGGESDGAAAVAEATFESGLATLLSDWQTAMSDTDLPIFMVSVDQNTTAAQDPDFAAIRQAMIDYAAAEADAHLVVPYQGFEIASPIQLEDTIHWNQTALNTVGSTAATNIAAILFP